MQPNQLRYHQSIFFLILILVAPSTLFAQTGHLSGLVLDRETGESVPFATIALSLVAEEVPLSGTTSDYDGKFDFADVPLGEYKLSISFIGYNTMEVPVELVARQTKLDLGTLFLDPLVLELDEVEVSTMAHTATSRLDRRSYRAEDFETARGGSATELLARLPSVSVSPDGEVSVRGTTDFIVYLNGRPTQIEPAVLLAQLQASSIVGVDIITVPTASFDAQGKGGIINITTKVDNIQGLSIAATGTLGAAPWGNRTEKFTGHKLKDDRYGGGINAVYSKNNWALFGSLNYNWRDANTSREGVARILDQSTGAYKHMVAEGIKPEWYENVSLNFGVESKLSEKVQIASSYYFGKQTEGRTAYYLYHNFFGDIEQNLLPGIDPEESWTLNPNTGIRRGEFHTANADLTYKISSVASWRFGALYEYSVLSHDIDNPNINVAPDQESLTDTLLYYRQGDRTPLHGLRFSADYSRNFENGMKLSIGYQPQYFNISGGFNYDTLDVINKLWSAYSSLENEIELERWIHAAYVDFAGTIAKLSFKAGLRMEYTNQALQIANPDYFSLLERPKSENFNLNQYDWFPSLHAAYPIDDRSRINLAASRRISRAPVKNMAPFLYRRHLEVYVVGDPGLKPEYINTIELAYNKGIGDQQFSLMAFYRGVENAIFRVNTVFEDELILIRSFTNAGQTRALGAELNANMMIGSWAKFFIGASLYNFHIKANIFGYYEDNQSTNWSLKGNANLKLNRQLGFSADFNLRSAEVTAQGEDGMRLMANAALAYSPQRYSAWTVTLRALNILDSNTRGVSTRAFNTEGVQIFYQNTDYYWYGPIAEISLTYNFNWKNQAKKGQESSFGRDEF